MSSDQLSKAEDSESSAPQSDIDALRSAQSLYYNLEDKIIDLTGPTQKKAKSIRGMLPISWRPYVKSNLIAEEDFAFLTAFQKSRTIAERNKVLEDYKLDAFKTLIKVTDCVHTVAEIQKVLVLIDDMLWEDLSRVHLFKEAVSDPWKVFMDLLSCSDEFVRNLSSRIITKLFAVNGCKPPDTDIKVFLNWLKHELKNDNNYLLCVARCLQKLLQIDEYREVFMNMKGIFRIIRILCTGIKAQAQYQLVFCIWVSSYNFRIAEKLNNYNTIEVLVELLECCPSEIIKLPRVILATFRNLLEKPREKGVKRQIALLMIQCKVLNILSVLKKRSGNFNDQEFKEDLEVIEEKLVKFVAELSTFDEYILEVRSGRLEWSIVHTSKPFWDENAPRLNENDYELLRILISLLEESKESKVLCVAAHDLGEYMSRYLRGRTLVENFGGKQVLLELLKHDEPMVKYHALKSLQILMLNNYDLLMDFTGNGNSDSKKQKRPKIKSL